MTLEKCINVLMAEDHKVRIEEQDHRASSGLCPNDNPSRALDMALESTGCYDCDGFNISCGLYRPISEYSKVLSVGGRQNEYETKKQGL